MPDQQSIFEWQGLAVEARLSSPSYLNPFFEICGGPLLHFEIESYDRKPLPVSETGYRSAYLRPEEIAEEGGLEAYARAWLDFAARSAEWLARNGIGAQLSFFE